MNSKIIVALNHLKLESNLDLIYELDELVDIYKIGIQTPNKDAMLAYLKFYKKKVFLDYKYYDIKSTIQNAIKLVDHQDIDFVTVHTDCIDAAMSVRKNVKILEVYKLTDNYSCRGPTFKSDGIIVSTRDAAYYKSIYPDLIYITPGIRLPEDNKDDHFDFSSPTEVKYSDYIVVGRPILHSDEPRKVVKKYLNAISI